MYARRIISVITAVLAVGICIFISYISWDVETSALVINLSFLCIMLIAVFASLFTGILRLTRISKSLAIATERIRTSHEEDGSIPDERLFKNEFLDDCYRNYHEMVEQHPDGSCDIADFINDDMIETYIHRSLMELIPDILTSLGILGTFIGLVLGLRSFDPSGYEQMADSVSPLIDGIKVAFVTSIYGLSLSLPFSFNLRSELSEMSDNLDAFTDTFYLYVRPSHEVDSTSKLAEQSKSREEFTNDLTQKFVEQMTACFERSISPAFSMMTSSIDKIVDNFTSSQQEAVAQICEEVISEMHSDLDNEFRRISETTRQLEKSQSEYTDFMDRSLTRMQQAFTSMQNNIEKSEQYNDETLTKLNKAQQDAFRINEDQNAIYQEYIRFMYDSIEKFSGIWEENSAKLQEYSDEIANMGPVQSNDQILKNISALSSSLDSIRKSQLMSSDLEPDSSTEEMFDEILQKLNRLEKTVSEPTLFRRKNKR